MPSLGGWELVIIVAVLLLLFGAKKLPDMARSVGQSARVFKGEMKGLKEDEGTKDAKDAAATEPEKTAPSPELPQAQTQAQTTAQASAQPSTAPPPQEGTTNGAAPQAQHGRTDST